MNRIWCLILAGTAIFSITKNVDLMAVLSKSAIETAQLCVRLAGGYALFGGLLSAVNACGAGAGLRRALRTPMLRLFPGLAANPPAQEAVCENLIANALGLGNAATPAGLRAMRIMREAAPAGDAATHDMCMLLILNATGVQLLPTGVMAMRAAAGSAAPGAIVLPTLCATALSTLVGVAVALVCRRRA